MIDSKRLLADLQRLLKILEADIRERLEAQPERMAELDAEWRAARDARRTAATQFEWREERTTQAGVHWILGTVFLRFLEDNGYLERPFLFGSERHTQSLAIDRHTRYFREHPDDSDREYLLHCFADAAELPGLDGLFDPDHNPLYRIKLTGDGAMALRDFWRRVDPDTGVVVHDFRDAAHGTRFLGDLYQDLSESARKRYALLQTPEFVEEFILDRTLTPAIETFGYRVVRLIDPTCGSGHFLLGAFRRMFSLWSQVEPARNLPDLAQRALDAVYGVDLNPFAVEIARFRLLVAALNACGIERLANAPDFRINLATGDSLLHGPRFGMRGTQGMFEVRDAYEGTGLAHAYAVEDIEELRRILGQQYHAVVGNPPYITPKDKALNDAYRARYATCHMKYSLGVPFTERFFELALRGAGQHAAGYAGLITTNTFMKREFGKKLVEQFLSSIDMTHLVDTSLAHIPGHGTPTVILFGRNQFPVSGSVRAIMGIQAERTTPLVPSEGAVWKAIVGQLDRPGSESRYASCADLPRSSLATHPWSIAGGGAIELKEVIEGDLGRLEAEVESIGFASFPGADDVFVAAASTLRRRGVEQRFVKALVVGDSVRDWVVQRVDSAFVPYGEDLAPIAASMQDRAGKSVWPMRAVLEGVKSFGGKTRKESGDIWWTWYRWVPSKYLSPTALTFAFVATHNHFVVELGGKVFKQSAPVIKLPSSASIDSYLGLSGLLNSSIACFWLKQVCHNKGGGGIGGGLATEGWEQFFEFTAAGLGDFPVPANRPLRLAKILHALAIRRRSLDPDVLATQSVPSGGAFTAAQSESRRLFRELVALQEELDWHCYGLYGLLPEPIETDAPPEICLGERAFEIVLARRIADGKEETTWFERHGSTPITELPARWPDDYRKLVERRIKLIESDHNIGLIERPDYKRRWNSEPWESQLHEALREWLLDRLETERYWPRERTPALRSVQQLADLVRLDAEFMQVAAFYAGRDDFAVTELIAQLVEAESVPYLPALRYKDDGLRRRVEWESVWAAQRREDAIDATCTRADAERRKLEEVGEIPVPPKYKSSDFQTTDIWRLRGALDVPKERFVSYPGATLDADGTLVVTWAGYDHLQRAKALAGHYLDLKDNHGWGADRLIPLLAGLAELLPWLKQWHNEPDPGLGERMGDYFEGFIQDEARAMGVTVDELRAWRPQAPVRARRRRS